MQPGYHHGGYQPGPYPGAAPPMDNNMTMSIVSLFFFWPLSIPAIMNASKVQPLVQQGQYAAAQAALAESKKWSKLAIIIGCVWTGVVLLACCGIFAAGGLGAIFSSGSPS